MLYNQCLHYIGGNDGEFPSVFKDNDTDDDDDDNDEGEDDDDINDYDEKDRHGTSRVKCSDPSTLDSSASATEVIKAWSHRLKGS